LLIRFADEQGTLIKQDK